MWIVVVDLSSLFSWLDVLQFGVSYCDPHIHTHIMGPNVIPTWGSQNMHCLFGLILQNLHPFSILYLDDIYWNLMKEERIKKSRKVNTHPTK
jgi:hypothetical protein